MDAEQIEVGREFRLNSATGRITSVRTLHNEKWVCWLDLSTKATERETPWWYFQKHAEDK